MGWDDRMKDSLQQVHSSPCSQITGILALVVLGLLMHGGMTTLYDYKPLTLLGFIGSVGSGMFWFIVKITGLADGNLASYSYTVCWHMCQYRVWM